MTGFLREGREIPFARLGDLSRSTVTTESQAIWNVEAPGRAYRLVGRGEKGKARVVSLLSLPVSGVQ